MKLHGFAWSLMARLASKEGFDNAAEARKTQANICYRAILNCDCFVVKSNNQDVVI